MPARVSLAILAACATSLAYRGEFAYAMLESGYGVYIISPCPRGAIASMLSGTLVWLLHAIVGWESFFNLSELLPVGLNCTALSFMAYWFLKLRVNA